MRRILEANRFQVLAAADVQSVVTLAGYGARFFILDIRLGDSPSRIKAGLNALSILRERYQNEIFVVILTALRQQYEDTLRRLGPNAVIEKSAQRGNDIRSVIALWKQWAEKTRRWLYKANDFKSSCIILAPDFAQINSELLEYFAANPLALHELSWRKFEEVLEAVFRNQGFRTEIGPGSDDGGVDLRLLRKDSIGEVVTLVQAKRYAPNRPISLEAVSALYGVVESENANRGLFVTTSRYLPSAERFAQTTRSRLVLATADDVARWCRLREKRNL
jgi:HJR/Mrr/RecB family endonuclease